MSMAPEPIVQIPRVMPPGIVDHDDHLAARSVAVDQPREEYLKSFCMEPFSLHRAESPISRTDRAPHGHLSARWCVQQDRITIFGSNPHRAPGTVLLEVTLVFEPQVNRPVGGEAPEFFYMPAEPLDQLEQSAVPPCGTKTQCVKQPLTLPNAQMQRVALGQMVAEQLPVPEML